MGKQKSSLTESSASSNSKEGTDISQPSSHHYGRGQAVKDSGMKGLSAPKPKDWKPNTKNILEFLWKSKMQEPDDSLILAL